MPVDPLSITVSVASLVIFTTKAAIGCHTLIEKYRGAPLCLSSILTECKTLRLALNHVHTTITRDQRALSTYMLSNPLLQDDFEVAITGCKETFTLLDGELQELMMITDIGMMLEWKDRLKYVWNEDAMTSILEQMRGLQGAVSLLLNALQAETVLAVYQLLASRAPVFERVKSQIASIRSSKGRLGLASLMDTDSITAPSYSSSIGPEEFSFDFELVNTTTYRKAFSAARTRARSAPPQSVDLNAGFGTELLINPPDSPADGVNSPIKHSEELEDRVSDALSVETAVPAKGLIMLPSLANGEGIRGKSEVIQQGVSTRETTTASSDDAKLVSTATKAITELSLPSIELTPPGKWAESFTFTSSQDNLTDSLEEASSAPFRFLPTRTKALLDYKATAADHLSFAAGSPLILTEIVDQAMYRGYCDEDDCSNAGLIPQYCVKPGPLHLPVWSAAGVLQQHGHDQTSTAVLQPVHISGEVIWLLKNKYNSYRLFGPSEVHAFPRMDAHILVLGDTCTGKSSAISWYLHARQLDDHSPTTLKQHVFTGELSRSGRPSGVVSFVTLHEFGGLDFVDLAKFGPPQNTNTILLCFSITDRNSLENLIEKHRPLANRLYPHAKVFVAGFSKRSRLEVEEGRLTSAAKLTNTVLPHTECKRVARSCGATAYLEAAFSEPEAVRTLLATVVGYTAAKRTDEDKRANWKSSLALGY